MPASIEYNGFRVVVTVTKEKHSHVHGWRGRFDVWKEDDREPLEPFMGTVSRPEKHPDAARSKALRIAKSIIDANSRSLRYASPSAWEFLARH